MKIVFNKSVLFGNRAYNPGDHGDFDEVTAKHLKGRGVASDYVEPKPVEVKTAVDPKPAEAKKAVDPVKSK